MKCHMLFQLSLATLTSICEKNYNKVFLPRGIEVPCLEYQHSLILSLYSPYKEFHVLS